MTEILKRKPKKQYLSIVPKSCSIYIQENDIPYCMVRFYISIYIYIYIYMYIYLLYIFRKLIAQLLRI